MIDASGNAAVYSYDAVGNILSISRYTVGQVAIFYFTPSSGTVGASVTVYGIGFSTTPSENTLRFNGVQATVTSATANQIVATVPAGASTGPISVTSPSGSATSGSTFTVNATLGTPSISSFTPTVGVYGTAVTVNGSNFETIAANNKVKFHLTKALVNSSTAMSLVATVPPSGTSGRLSLVTSAGSTTSTSDFFVPPSPYTAADVDFTARMQIDGNVTVNLPAANKIGLVVFDGTAGQSISLNMTNVTIPSHIVIVKKPDGAAMWTGTGFMDQQTLATTGAYTVLIDPAGAVTGNISVSVTSP